MESPHKVKRIRRGGTKKLEENRTRHQKLWKSIGIVFVFGMLFGMFSMIYLQRKDREQWKLLYQNDFAKLCQMRVQYAKLFAEILMHQYKAYVLFWIFSFTIFGVPYAFGRVCYTGIWIGILLTNAVLQYGIKGMIFFLASFFPQCIFYASIFGLMLVHGLQLSRELYFMPLVYRRRKRKVILEKIPVIVILAVFLFFGCICETYLNSFLLQKLWER